MRKFFELIGREVPAKRTFHEFIKIIVKNLLWVAATTCFKREILEFHSELHTLYHPLDIKSFPGYNENLFGALNESRKELDRIESIKENRRNTGTRLIAPQNPNLVRTSHDVTNIFTLLPLDNCSILIENSNRKYRQLFGNLVYCPLTTVLFWELRHNIKTAV